MLEETFVDRSRETDPTPRDPGDEDPERTIETTIWYPERGGEVIPGRFPIVVFSHGLGADPHAYAALFESWVEAGFVVVGPTYPLTHSGIATVPGDLVQQPADAAFVLERVIDLDADPAHPLGGHLDTKHLAAAGHSLGGMTTLGMLKTCCAEHRLAAAVVLAGSEYGFSEEDFVAATPPILFVHGDEDRVVPLSAGRRVYDELSGRRAFLTLHEAGHAAEYHDGSNAHHGSVAAIALRFLQWAVKGEDAALARLRRDLEGNPRTSFDDQLGAPASDAS